MLLYVGGEDYNEVLLTSETVEFTFDRKKRSSQISETRSVTLYFLSDDLVENDEFFILYLKTLDSSVLLNPSSANVIIQNNDCT